MIELTVSKCSVGNYNWANSKEKSLSFYAELVDENGTIIVDGVKAQIHYNGEPEYYNDFNNTYENLDWIFGECMAYAKKVISSVDYEAQTILFGHLFYNNYAEIDTAYKNSKIDKLKTQIEKLNKELNYLQDDKYGVLPELRYELNASISGEITKVQRWVDLNNNEMAQLKEDSEKFKKLQQENEKYLQKIKTLESKLITEEICHYQ